jgi:bacteriocin-like protein
MNTKFDFCKFKKINKESLSSVYGGAIVKTYREEVTYKDGKIDSLDSKQIDTCWTIA